MTLSTQRPRAPHTCATRSSTQSRCTAPGSERSARRPFKKAWTNASWSLAAGHLGAKPRTACLQCSHAHGRTQETCTCQASAATWWRRTPGPLRDLPKHHGRHAAVALGPIDNDARSDRWRPKPSRARASPPCSQRRRCHHHAGPPRRAAAAPSLPPPHTPPTRLPRPPPLTPPG